ncbi:hypothetical protein GYMLUDRAFT_60952 [Collybiopsis luxurians FD-317 M1]|uniref:Unplaced genomic scaffold GYMLUscaffold_39, whole genome shotgun sequence n=1 Tax=Collybiopsis luxurians FD-317 M1 TaxID=944289 RepID=A0A0D0BS53_9AGAR|nr:hypothetical protein GYMLUDRAFT_60952 [Collybiopsis luxurians FD-317 M1]
MLSGASTTAMMIPSSFPNINRIQSEILLKIFRFCSTITASEFEQGPQPSFHAQSLALSHVNKRWRRIALSASSLWSTIYLGFDSASLRQPIWCATKTLVELYLERSREATLDICVLLSDYSLPKSGEGKYRGKRKDDEPDTGPDLCLKGGVDPVPLLPLFFKHAARWRSAVLQISWDGWSGLIFPSTFPVLEKLDIRCISRSTDDFDRQTIFFIPKAFRHAPLLRKLSIENFAFKSDFKCVRGFDEINLFSVDTKSALQSLRYASHQCKTRIHIISHSDNDKPSPLPRTESWTKTFSLSVNDDAGILPSLMAALMLLNIESIEFNTAPGIDSSNPNNNKPIPFPIDECLSLLHRSSVAKLTSLHLSGQHITDRDLLRIVKQLPVISSFTFREPAITASMSKQPPLRAAHTTAYGSTPPDSENSNPHTLTPYFFKALMTLGGLDLRSNKAVLPLLPNLTYIELSFRSHSSSTDRELSKCINSMLVFLECRRPTTPQDRHLFMTGLLQVLQKAEICIPRKSFPLSKQVKRTLAKLRSDGLAVSVGVCKAKG